MAATWNSLEVTADDTVRIEAKDPGYIRYQASNGRRWEVRGVCDKRGFCLIGAAIKVEPTAYCDGLIRIKSLEHIEELKAKYGIERIDSELDVPVGPGFEGCCPLEITVLAD